MKARIGLSNKEKKYYFIYLLVLLLFFTFVISYALLRDYTSPFAASKPYNVMKLQEKARFEEAQKPLFVVMDSTFVQLKNLSETESQPMNENKIQSGIDELDNAFRLTDVKDPRKDGYPVISKFYAAYLQDKKQIRTIDVNKGLIKKNLEDCKIGYKGILQDVK